MFLTLNSIKKKKTHYSNANSSIYFSALKFKIDF